MQLFIAAKQPYSFAQTVAFLRRFPPCQGDYVITDDSITAAVSVRGIAHAFTLRASNQLTIDLPRHVDAATQEALKTGLARRAQRSPGTAEPRSRA